MTVPRIQLLWRGMHGLCPNCCSPDIFQSRYRLRDCCPGCGLPLEKEDGWGIGAIPLNYSFTCLVCIFPIGLLFLFDWLPLTWALALAGIGSILVPLLTYRYSKGLWTGIYYAVLPDELPSSKSGKKEGAPDKSGTPRN